MSRSFGLMLALLAGVAAAPNARADDDCQVDLGRGWPPATENYGAAVEGLFNGKDQPVLSLTRLPARAAESGLQLFAGEGQGDWTLRYSEADERVEVWTSGRRELRVQQTPDVQQVPMPAALATRVLDDWQQALASLAPATREAQFHENAETLVFTAGDVRVSGLQPDCGVGKDLMRTLAVMVKATDDDDERRVRRWQELGEELDRIEQGLGAAGARAGASHGNN